MEYHPTAMLDREHRVPERLTTGKASITIRFQTPANARTGGVFEVRTIQSRVSYGACRESYG